MHDPAQIEQSGLGVQARIYISPLGSELMIPSKIKIQLLDDDFPSSMAFKGRGPFKLVGVR